MKKLILLCAFLISMHFTCFSEVIREDNTFSMTVNDSTSIETSYKWKDRKGNTYPIYKSKNNSFYVLRTSKKTGKQYRYYIPSEIQEELRKIYNIPSKP